MGDKELKRGKVTEDDDARGIFGTKPEAKTNYSCKTCSTFKILFHGHPMLHGRHSLISASDAIPVELLHQEDFSFLSLGG